jgi:hypothetical protein
LCQFYGMAACSKIDDSSPDRAAPLCRSAPAGSIVDLRNLLAERFPQPFICPAPRLATGVPGLDEAIGGGLPKSAITELSSPQVSAGSALLLYALLQSAQRDGYFLALVDGRDSFDPSASGGLGNRRLRNLLWVRCTKALDAVKAADLLLRDGNVPFVMFDLVLNPKAELRKIPATTWYRFQRILEQTSTVCLVFTPWTMIASARARLNLNSRFSLDTLDNEPEMAVQKLEV